MKVIKSLFVGAALLYGTSAIAQTVLPTLIALPENAIQEMCKGATLNALSLSNTLEVANTGNYWAELTVKDSE